MVAIQNMTWKGLQGFQKKPSTSLVGNAEFGLRGSEQRGLSYYTFDNAGHRVAQDDPNAALYWLKKVVLG